MRMLPALLLSALLVSPSSAAELTVREAGPTGELSSVAQSNEVRIVFSEPMVALGRIPDPVSAPYLRIAPAVAGKLRWSGTTTLILTPDKALPYATRFDVTVDAGATSLSGNKLARPHAFSFTTPTVRLQQASWYRKTGKSDSPLLLALRFNQPVKPAAALLHLGLRYHAHEWEAPAPPQDPGGRLSALDPQALADFEAKVAATRAVAARTGALSIALARDWNKDRFKPGDDLVVLETVEVPPPGAHLKLVVGPRIEGAQGKLAPGKPQERVLRLEPAFFVTGLRCQSACDPDSFNPLTLAMRTAARAVRDKVRVLDVTTPGRDVAVRRGDARQDEDAEEDAEDGGEVPEDEQDYTWSYDLTSEVTLDDAGFSLKPAHGYVVSVDRALQSSDGQTLGYTWMGGLENWHQRGFTSFGTGHGVWEASGGGKLPFYARNVRSLTQWANPLALPDLVPSLKLLEEKSFDLAPSGPGTPRKLEPKPDEIQSHALDLGGALGGKSTGLAWLALKDGELLARTPKSDAPPLKSTLVQVTNLGLSVKDSPQNTLVLVTRLDDGRPVEGATVSIRNLANEVVWTGPTDKAGIALAEGVDLRKHDGWWQLAFVVTAEKDGDVAYLASNWTEGIEPWAFETNYDLDESKPLLRGSVFADRGVYKLGEEVKLKMVLRSDTARGMNLLSGSRVKLVLRDSQGDDVDTREVTLGEWSSADWAVKLPADGKLGTYSVEATVPGQQRSVSGSFLVAAYRRPDFRVDANLAGETAVAGVTLKGVVTGRYLFGAPMAKQKVKTTLSRKPLFDPPAAVAGRFDPDRYALVDEAVDRWAHEPETVKRDEAALDAEGQLAADLPTEPKGNQAYEYTFEGEVTDVSRQSIAGRASFRVEPAPWYVGFRRPPFFADAKAGFDTEVVAAALDGQPAPGVKVKVTLSQVQWHSVRRAEGDGFYTWETERQEKEVGSWDVVTTATGAPLHVAIPEGGLFSLRASAGDGAGHQNAAATTFYAVGAGYTAWERHDHNRIDVVPEKKRYRPGETARLLVKSPWEKATALVTTEREGVRTWKVWELSSTQETIPVPLTEAEIPNVYVSVLLVKGRSGSYSVEDSSDPGKPAFRLGYAKLEVEDRSKRLEVALRSDREEYRPGAKARVEVVVKDAKGAPASAEVTLWAVDYGVLSLTGYQTPELLGSVWVEKALQVMNTDSRQKIISRRVTVPKGGEDGGGGGADSGPGTVRKDFRVLAFWLGSLPTDAQGKASAQVTLPESLTTYRIMAVASDKTSRFGAAQREIRTSKPVLLRSAFPRFLALGDSAFFGSVVQSQLKEKGTAIVTMRSLDPAVVEVTGDPKQTLAVDAKGSAEARFHVRAKATGPARLEMTVKLSGEGDAFQEVLPVRVLASPEVVAAYGQSSGEAKEAVELPAGVVPSYGGLQLEASSTALVGLGEGARYLADYPYGCAEQRASSALGLALAADLGDAFRLPGIEPARMKQAAAETFAELRSFQCDDGGFTYWKGGCGSVGSSPYLSSWVLHVLQRGKALGHPVAEAVLEKGYAYLEQELSKEPPKAGAPWPAYGAWQSYAVKVLAEGGQKVDSHLTRLTKQLDHTPVFGIAYLADAMAAKGEKGPRADELARRLKNAVLPEGGSAHVQELSDPYLSWFWNSNVRSSAIVLRTFVQTGSGEALVPGLVRWLMNVRKNGRWGNTQENAHALEALVDYYRKYESEPPDFRAVVTLGAETLLERPFQGRSTEVHGKQVPMAELMSKGEAGRRLDLGFRREGTGTLHYVARLKYAPEAAGLSALDQGFQVERSYAPVAGGEDSTRFKAGDLVRVTLKLRLPKERRFVAVVDPIPAGFEPVESWFATTARELAPPASEEGEGGDWMSWWERGGFDHVERHDDRVQLFGTRLGEGNHVFSYVVRATTAGSFVTAPAHAEEMYEPEVFGRSGSAVIEVAP